MALFTGIFGSICSCKAYHRLRFLLVWTQSDSVFEKLDDFVLVKGVYGVVEPVFIGELDVIITYKDVLGVYWELLYGDINKPFFLENGGAGMDLNILGLVVGLCDGEGGVEIGTFDGDELDFETLHSLSEFEILLDGCFGAGAVEDWADEVHLTKFFFVV
eukprot:CAMPEP_0114603236 /NCGR_PEP_ID=MMETSP0125-20121206/25675_1 /TAXON_ID=485358 ORGANISM="Aristerostoma sp., Strain ATCC 50986" /NCGR_SAMPLE_ID=MMETSP0125 /ASSEMBLY_ACC=CAM_ASM_000245 /LENGTH=159 /DNA_ID=CAMNT_0001813903 /DNA_START=543 /DNA_END=1018 /DNA_ORIENTATION=-